MQVIIFGAPGVGKGTQAKILASKLGIAHISTGDILREAIKNGTVTGLKAKAIVESGGLVPDEIMGGIIKDALKEGKYQNGSILDGFPRTKAQALILDQIFAELSVNKPVLIKIDADDKIIIDRISNRLVCNSCGNILVKNDVSENFVCPVCNSKNSYIKRKDDAEEVIKRRLELYHEMTAPVFEHYKDKAKIIEVDGTEAIGTVTRNILRQI